MKQDSKRPTDPDDLRRRAEERLKSQLRTVPDVAAAVNDQRLIHELRIAQIELELQNEELRESRAAAEEGRARYAELYDFAPVGYVTLTLDGTIVESNLASARLLGCERTRLRGTRLEVYVETADRPVVSDFLQRVFSNPAESTCEVTLSSSDRPARIIQIDATVSRTAQECHAVLIDITEHKRSDATLRESESSLRAIFDTEPECVKLLGPNCALLEMNRAGLLMIEADSFEQVRGQSMLELVLPEYRPAFAALSDNALRGESGILEFEIHGLQGKHRWLQSHVAPYRDSAGNIVAVLGITLDITLRRQSLNLLAHERSILEFIARGAAEIDVLLNLVLSHERLFPGMIASVLLVEKGGLKIRHVTAPGLPAEFVQAIDGAEIGPHAGSCGTAAFTGKTVVVADIATDELWKDWREVALQHGLRACWSVPIMSSTKEIYGTFAVYRHMIGEPSEMELSAIESSARLAAIAIERRRTERSLRESETRFSKVFRASPEAMVIAELPAGRIIDVNDSFVAQTGFHRDEAIGRSTLDLNLWEDVRQREQLYADLRDTSSVRQFEAVLRIKSGELRIVEFSGVRVELDGRPCVVTISRDITARRRAEALLSEREQQLRLFVEHSPAAIAMFDRDMRYLVNSRRWLTDYGLGEQVLDGRSHYDVFPDLPEDWKAVHRKCLNGAIESCEEDSFVRPDGITEWLRWEIRPWQTAKGEVGGLIIFSEVITARKLAEEKLRLSEARFRRIVESDLMGMLFWTDTGEVTEANNAFLRIIGYSREDLLAGRVNWRKLTPPEFANLDDHALREIEASGSCTPFEKEYLHRNGSRVPVLIGRTAIPEQPGQGVAFVIDITDRKRAEEAARKSQELVKDIVNSVDGIVWEADVNTFRFTFVSEQAERILGYPLERWTTEPTFWRDHIHPEDRDAAVEFCVNSTRRGESHEFEYRMLSADGREVWLKDIVTVMSQDGVPVKLRGIMVDITDRKRIDAALIESERHFRELFEQATDGILVCDSQLNFVDVNESICRMLGYTRDELLAMHAATIIAPEERARVASEVDRLADGRAVQSEWWLQRKDGTEFLGEVAAKRLPDGRLQTFVRDITERRQAEELIRASEERFATVFRSSPVGISISTFEEGVFLDVNEAFLEIVGYSRAEVLGRSSLDLSYWIDPDNRRGLVEALKNDGSVKNREVKFRRKDGSIGDSLRSLERITISGKDCILTILNDITERKQIQEALLQSEKNYKVLVDGAIEGVVLHQDRIIRFANPSAARIFGFENSQQMLGLDALQTLVAPEDRRRINERYDLLNQGHDLPLVTGWRSQHQDGTSVRIQSSGSRVQWNGRPAILGFYIDVTEQYQAEVALRDSELRLRMIVQASNVGLWDWNLVTDEVYYSPEWKSQLGYLEDEVGDTFQEWKKRVHPDDLPAALTVASDFREGRNDQYDIEFRMRHKDGSWRWILSRADILCDAVGRPIRMMGCHVDITARKLIEESLRQSQEQYKILVEGAIEAIVLHQDMIIRFANPAAARTFGFEHPYEMVGLHFIETFVVPEDRLRLQERTANVLRGEAIPVITGWRALCRNGKTKRLQSCASLVNWNGRPASLGFHIDITEQYQAEEELRLSRERLETLSRQLIATQENERRHLARELHDEIGQMLTGIKLNLRMLQQPEQAVSLESIVPETIKLVDETVQQVRNLALELRPSMLDDLGLLAALRWCLDRQARLAGFVATLVAESSDRKISPDIATACYRVAQECLTNISRHAHAHNVRVELHHRETELELLVSDDGSGFDVAAARYRAAQGQSLGLLGMEERVELVGGRFEITSAPSEGTTMRALFPLKGSPEGLEE